MILEKYGYIRAAAAVPRVRVGDTAHNAREIISLIKKGAEEHDVKVMVFPELSVTGYTCGELFLQETLLTGAENALGEMLDATRSC
ncbi:MAG: NAD(+) synthase, partial [Clostridiales bacterium]|nr:NAD(+) synthase [Clostridiales bacterium]